MKKQHEIILDDSNITESYPGITLPLTESFIKQAYYEIFKGVLLRLVGDEKIVEENNENLKNMIDSYNGKIYYRISNWYSVIKYMPLSHKIIPIWQEMMGVNNKKESSKQHRVSVWRKAIVTKNVLTGIIKTPQEMAALDSVFLNAEKYFNENYSPNLSNERLKDLYETLLQKVISQWDVTIANDMYAFVFTGLTKKRLPDANKYISSTGNIESMKPVKALLDIIRLTIKTDSLNELRRMKSTDDVERFLSSKSELSTRINRYIVRYGDRYLDELKLESPTYRTNPKLLVDKIIEYIKNYTGLNDVIESKPLTPPKSSWLTKKFLGMAITGIKNRESSRLNRARLYGMVRTIFLTIGKNLADASVIDHKNDVFYLSIQEIFAYVDGNQENLEKIVKSRKKEYAVYEKLPVLHRLRFIDGKLQPDNEQPLGDNGLIGTPVSSGTVTAEVVIVHNAHSAKDISGKILVTKTTDPSWVFLLVNAAGIIAEKGSLLSHTAIISRELSVPAIVNVPNATTLLKDGDVVTMDCSTGKIAMVNERKEN
jgi:pyruvate,water dikinase